MIRLPVLCPQEYEDVADMRVTSCTRCTSGWSTALGRCTIYTGAEELDDEPGPAPRCPIADRCQHQLQAGDGLCVVRTKGLVCESALALEIGIDAAKEHPLAFNACLI